MKVLLNAAKVLGVPLTEETKEAANEVSRSQDITATTWSPTLGLVYQARTLL